MPSLDSAIWEMESNNIGVLIPTYLNALFGYNYVPIQDLEVVLIPTYLNALFGFLAIALGTIFNLS